MGSGSFRGVRAVIAAVGIAALFVACSGGDGKTAGRQRGWHCSTEIGSRRDAMPVSQCPPVGEQAPIRCAQAGENCRAEYLADNELEGCCDGTLCKTDSSGVPLCAAATPEEITAMKQCKRGAHDLKVAEAIQTAAGPVTISNVFVSELVTGPGGCLVSLKVGLDACMMQIGPARDATGAYVVNTQLCGNAGLGRTVTGTAVFSGVTCDTGLVSGTCFSGSIELRLTSTGAGLVGNDQTPVLTGMPFHLEGEACDTVSTVAATCGG